MFKQDLTTDFQKQKELLICESEIRRTELFKMLKTFETAERFWKKKIYSINNYNKIMIWGLVVKMGFAFCKGYTKKNNSYQLPHSK